MSVGTDGRLAPSTAPLPPPDEAAALEARPPSWRVPISLGVLGLFALVVFGLGADGAARSSFGLSRAGDTLQLDALSVPTKVGAILAAVGCLVLAGYAAARVRQRRKVPAAVVGGFAALWLIAFLVESIAEKQISLPGLLGGTVALAVPLIFGSLSGVICERAGVINIAIEGQLLAGAFLAAVVASLSNHTWAGLVAAPVAGVLVALLLAIFTLRYFVDQIIVGVVLNVLVIGVTGFLYGRLLSPEQEQWNSPSRFGAIDIPVLGDIPIIGPVLFNQTIIVYLMYVVVVLAHIALFKTRWGLRVRAVGEHPTAADTVGIKVNALRFKNVLLGGAIAGLGGAYFTLGSVGAFGREMTAGQGFIALAAMIFGRWSPIGALFAALLFGFANNLQAVLGSIGAAPVPGEFMLMAPYIVTIFAVAGLVGRVRAPAADGQPYIKS